MCSSVAWRPRTTWFRWFQLQSVNDLISFEALEDEEELDLLLIPFEALEDEEELGENEHLDEEQFDFELENEIEE